MKKHIHTRLCYDDPGAAHGSPFLVCKEESSTSVKREITICTNVMHNELNCALAKIPLDDYCIPCKSVGGVFVFGSNERGVHGAGAARYALEHCGAVLGKGFGYYGNSFAIPTKDLNIQTLPLEIIKEYVDQFIKFASLHSEFKFRVTAIGCGLAGYTHEQMAPLFQGAPENCWFDESWKPWLPEHKFWGTF